MRPMAIASIAGPDISWRSPALATRRYQLLLCFLFLLLQVYRVHITSIYTCFKLYCSALSYYLLTIAKLVILTVYSQSLYISVAIVARYPARGTC